MLDGQGNLCVLDYKLKNLVVFDPQGRWLRTIGGAGGGPGEVSDARRVFLRDGRFGLLQAVPGAIVWLNADGSLDGKVRIGAPGADNEFLYNAPYASAGGDEILAWIGYTVLGPQGIESEEYIARLQPTGELGARLYEAPESESAVTKHGLDEEKVYNIWEHRFSCDGQGGLWVAPERNEWLLQRWNGGGRLIRDASRGVQPCARTDAERERLTSWHETRGWTREQIDIDRYAPLIRRLRCADDGSLWVERDLGGRAFGSDLEAVIDVVGLDGRWLRQLRIHTELNVYSRLTVNDETVFLVTIDPDTEEMWLHLCRLTPQR